jgi:hypothetical protein
MAGDIVDVTSQAGDPQSLHVLGDYALVADGRGFRRWRFGILCVG